MKRIGWIIAVLLLGLVACSSPDGLTNPPQLEAQFGTAEDDVGLDVAFASTGRIYSLARESGPVFDEYGDETGYRMAATIRRYDSSGKLVWTRDAESQECDYEFDDCGSLIVRSLETNTQGKIYMVNSYSGPTGDCMTYLNNYVDVFDANGNELDYYALGGTGANFGDDGYNTNVAFTVDGSGNMYTGLEKATLDPNDTCEATGRVQSVSKRSASGGLQWQRISTVGDVIDIVISPGGSLYVAGTKGLARYDTSGNLKWTKAIGPLENVVVSGSNIYTRYRLDIRKFDANGKQLWLKKQSGLSGIVVQDMAGDTGGNLYLSGKYNASSTNRNPFARKLNSSGSTLWTKTYGTTAYDDALAIATINGSETYVTGETQGSLSHTNIGGRDGYLRKLNSSGNLVWSK